MILTGLGRIAVFKHIGDVLFVVCEGEMVKFASAAHYELEDEKNT